MQFQYSPQNLLRKTLCGKWQSKLRLLTHRLSLSRQEELRAKKKKFDNIFYIDERTNNTIHKKKVTQRNLAREKKKSPALTIIKGESTAGKPACGEGGGGGGRGGGEGGGGGGGGGPRKYWQQAD